MESLSAQVPFDWWIADENRPMHRQSSWLQYFVVPWKVEDRALGTAYVMQSYDSCCGRHYGRDLLCLAGVPHLPAAHL